MLVTWGNQMLDGWWLKYCHQTKWNEWCVCGANGLQSIAMTSFGQKCIPPQSLMHI